MSRRGNRARSGATTALRAALASGLAVTARPGLWATAAVEYRRMVPDAWWRRKPWLPVPDRAMLGFRSETQYGDPDQPPDPDDLVTWLRWCKAENRRRRIG